MAWAIPLIGVLAQVGSGIYGSVSAEQQASKGRKQARQMEAQRQQFWKEHAYRSPEAIASARKQGSAEIEASRAAGQERLTQAIGPARGWGRGSGVLGAAMRELEADKLKSLAGHEARMTHLATTPMWGYNPYSGGLASLATQQGEGYGGMATGLSDIFGKATGYIDTLYGGGNNDNNQTIPLSPWGGGWGL